MKGCTIASARDVVVMANIAADALFVAEPAGERRIVSVTVAFYDAMTAADRTQARTMLAQLQENCYQIFAALVCPRGVQSGAYTVRSATP